MTMPIIDRRGQSNKHTGNVERLKKRHDHLRQEAVERALTSGSIKGIQSSEEVRIPKKDLSQPVFRISNKGGKKEMVHPGNDQYYAGDKIKRPEGGNDGSGGKNPGNGSSDGDGDGEDNFSYTLPKDEIMNILFDGLGLPNMTKRFLMAPIQETRLKRAGFSSSGTPNNLHAVRSIRQSLARRIPIEAPRKRLLIELEDAFQKATTQKDCDEIQLKIAFEKARPRVPFLDPIDLRFRSFVQQPKPMAKTVMFCLMDVSGSMDEEKKKNAKLYFMVMYLFLQQQYKDMEVVFLRYHMSAKECQEDEFFNSKESGGTVVSSGLKLMDEIIKARYNSGDWNIYGALAGDGDLGMGPDAEKTKQHMIKDILPVCQYFTHLELANAPKELGELFQKHLGGFKNFAQRLAKNRGEIIPVFRELFKKQNLPVEEHYRHAAFAEPMIALS